MTRFRLTTLLLFLTLLCVALGWYTDRRRQKQQYDKLNTGAACFFRMQTASDVLGIAVHYSADKDSLFRSEFDDALLSMYKHRDAVDLFLQSKRPNQENFTAVSVAGTSLWFLGLRSTAQYFSKVDDSSQSDHTLLKSEQMEGFRDFLDSAFTLANGR